jgi:hypothetical protein
MKKLCSILIVSFGLVTVHDLKSVYADGGGGVPLSQLAGGYASTVTAALAICLDPTSFVEESCATGGALVVTVTNLAAGELTLDQKGNTCGTYTGASSNLPLDASRPQIIPFHVAATTINYDPASGTGDWPYTLYSGGKCKGAEFDSTGATVSSTGKVHFVASGHGTRIDGVFTATTDVVGGIGDFSATLLNSKQ